MLTHTAACRVCQPLVGLNAVPTRRQMSCLWTTLTRAIRSIAKNRKMKNFQPYSSGRKLRFETIVSPLSTTATHAVLLLKTNHELM